MLFRFQVLTHLQPVPHAAANVGDHRGAGGARVAVDPAAPGAQKLDAAVRAWAAMRARRDSGEISEEEYLDWKRGFAGR